jgi:hypothetical protein
VANLILQSRFTRQPQYPVEIDLGNPLSRGLTDVFNPLGLTNRTSIRGYTPSVSAGSIVSGGGQFGKNIVLPAGTANCGLIIAGDGDDLFPSATDATIFVIRRSLDTTARSSTLFGYSNQSEATDRVLCHAPYSDGNLYFDYGGTAATNRISVAFTKSTTPDYMVFVAGGGKGREVWRNRVKIAGDTGKTGSRSATVQNFRIGSVPHATNAITSDFDEVYLFGVANRAWSDAEIGEWFNNPWQIFRKRPQILYFDVASGGATDLTIADATHSHSADNAVLTSSHLLTVADATHAHSADNVALSTAILLALADALHGHTADNLTLTLAGSEDLVIADASHAHTADSLSLTTLSVLVVAEALHSHLADNVVLSIDGVIGVPANLTGTPAIDSIVWEWDAVSGATGYEIEYGPDGGAYDTQDVGDTLTYTQTSLSASTLYEARVRAYVDSWTPAELFASSEVGVWYDPSDFDTMYQDSFGATQVTAVSQPVGLLLDKSEGLALGSENVADPSTWTTQITDSPNWSIDVSTGVATCTGASASSDDLKIGTTTASVIGEIFKVTFTLESVSGAGFTISSSRTTTPTFSTSSGTYTRYISATATSTGTLFINTTTGSAGVISNISVKKLSGNHALEATAAERPLLDTANLINYDGTDDLLTAGNPNLGTDVTVARATAGGVSILTGQTVGANYVDTTDHYGLVIVNRALTTGETASLTDYLEGFIP